MNGTTILGELMRKMGQPNISEAKSAQNLFTERTLLLELKKNAFPETLQDTVINIGTDIMAITTLLVHAIR